MRVDEIIVQTGHTGGATSVEFSPDGRYLATTSADETIRIWDVRLSACVRVLRGHRGPVYQARYVGSSSERLLSVSWDRRVLAWDVFSNNEPREILTTKLPTKSLDVDPTGRSFVVGSQREVLAGDLASGVARLRLDVEGLPTVAISGDSHLFAESDSTGGITVRELGTGTTLWKAGCPEARTGVALAPSVAFSPDGRHLACGWSWANELRILAAADGRPVRALSPGAVQRLRFRPDGTLVAFCEEAVVEVDLASGSTREVFRGTALAEHPDGSLFVDLRDGTPVLLETRSRFEIRMPKLGPTLQHSNLSRQFALAVNPMFPQIATSDPSGLVRLWDLRRHGPPSVLPASDALIDAMVFDPRGMTLATGDSRGRLKLWSCTTNVVTNEFDLGHSINGLAFHPFGAFLAISSDRSVPKVLEFPSLRVRSLGDSSDTQMQCICVSPGGDEIVTGAFDKLRFWDVERGSVAHYNTQSVSAIAMTRATLVVAMGYNKWLASHDDVAPPTVVVIDQSGPKTTGHRLNGHDRGAIHALAVDADGSLVASGGEDGRICLWNLSTGALVATSNAHGGSVTGLGFTSDEGFLASLGMDGVLRLWEVPELKPALAFVSVEGDEYVAIADDGAYACSRGGLRSVVFRAGAGVFSFDQFDAALNRPDRILERHGSALPQTIRDLASVRRARLARLKMSDTDPSQNPPVLAFQGPAPVRTTDAETVQVAVAIDQGDRPVNRLLVTANDVPVFGARGLELAPRARSCMVDIPLAAGDTKLQITAVDDAGTESLRLTWRTARTTPASTRVLHVIAVGISEYQDARWRLALASKDAHDLTEAFQRLARRFTETKVTLLCDRAATREAVVALRPRLSSTATDDQIVLFFAGHGVAQDGTYYFLPTDADTDRIPQTCVSLDDIYALFDAVPARRRLVLLDTCQVGEPEDEVAAGPHPGRVAEKPMISELFGDLRRDTGAFVLGAARYNEEAAELRELGNGVFTSGVLRILSEGVKGVPAEDLRVSHMRDAVTAFVVDSSRGTQNPVVRRENIEDDFLLF